MAGAVKRYMEIELPRQIRRKVEEDTGQLLDSIRYVVKRDGEDSVTVSMTISAPYTRFLEYGTQYMPPKRFVKNTRQNVKRNIRRGLEAAFFAVLGGEGEQ